MIFVYTLAHTHVLQVAGMVETQRRTALTRGGNISVMTQILQYALVGASEVLASIGQIEFFYDQVCLLLVLPTE